MSFMPLRCAVGHGPDLTIPAAATVALAPNDNSVDSNRIIITGSGTINSFGVVGQEITETPEDSVGQILITKQVFFQPDTGKTITLHHNPPALTLMGGLDRTIASNSIGTYSSDPNGNWIEEGFTNQSSPPGGGVVSWNYYNTSQTITILSSRALVRMWGGSGATWGGDNTGSTAQPDCWSGGTGAGGYLEKFLTGLTPGHTLTFTCGNAGAISPSVTAGTASILANGTQTIATLTANGSVGNTDNVNFNGTPGGTATGGDINLTGQSGGHGFVGANGGGIGGSTGLARGALGTINGVGIPGNPGGLIIMWL